MFTEENARDVTAKRLEVEILRGKFLTAQYSI